jgi:hypothetical protein
VRLSPQSCASVAAELCSPQQVAYTLDILRMIH